MAQILACAASGAVCFAIGWLMGRAVEWIGERRGSDEGGGRHG